MNNICIDIPVYTLSTRILNYGDIQKRVLTPFGRLDLTFRNTSEIRTSDRRPPAGGPPSARVVIDVEGDTDQWLVGDHQILEFRLALCRFIWRIAQCQLNSAQQHGSFDLYLMINGKRHCLPRLWAPEGSGDARLTPSKCSCASAGG